MKKLFSLLRRWRLKRKNVSITWYLTPDFLRHWRLKRKNVLTPWRLTLEIVGIIVGIIGGVLGFISFYQSMQNRVEDSINNAWNSISTAKEQNTGNIGLVRHLEKLASMNSDMSQIRLPGAYLASINLSGARLWKADLHEAKLQKANLRLTGLRGANLHKSNLILAQLASTDLSEADLREANLFGTDLRETDLSKANLQGADLSGSDLRGATLVGADLTNANITFSRLPENYANDWHSGKITDLNTKSIDLRSAKLCLTKMPDGSECNRDCEDFLRIKGKDINLQTDSPIIIDNIIFPSKLNSLCRFLDRISPNQFIVIPADKSKALFYALVPKIDAQREPTFYSSSPASQNVQRNAPDAGRK
jgi:hypothetical protein